MTPDELEGIKNALDIWIKKYDGVITPQEAVQIWYDKFGADVVLGGYVGIWLNEARELVSAIIVNAYYNVQLLVNNIEEQKKDKTHNTPMQWQLTPEALKLINNP